jgi:septal ring factor EnvC (AmiA/AmiB activator)
MSGTLPGYGHVVLLEHGEGYFSLYGFLSDSRVAAGATVPRGGEVGNAGIDPLTGRPAVYFELRHKERALDPAAWIQR